MCIFYALFGIPINVLFLQAIGQLLLIGQQKLVRKLESCYRKQQVQPRYLNEKCSLASLFLLLLVIFLGAGVQVVAEGWTFLEGVYCYFITFTTIGFGDFIPEKRRKDFVKIMQPCFIIFGLIAMSNVLNAALGCVEVPRALSGFFCKFRRRKVEEDGEERDMNEHSSAENQEKSEGCAEGSSC